VSIAAAIQSPDIGDVVELYEVDCMAIFGEVLRYTPAPLIVDRNTPVPQPIVWRGDTYIPRACKGSGWLWDGQGPLPQPKLSLGNTDRAIGALCVAYGDLQGAVVTRHRVKLDNLDDMPDADPDVEFDPDIYAIDQKTLQNRMVVEFTLGSAIDVIGKMIPGRQVLQAYCPFRYRSWNGTGFNYNQGSAACPYTGMAFFDANGNPTPDPAKDVCSKRLAGGCKKRFPVGDLPFGGFPGAAKYRG
jgi:lambda family phage minor tail protein L